MPKIFPPHKPNKEKLKKIIEEMKKLGSPTIRMIPIAGGYQALEGSHRLAAAHELNLPIKGKLKQKHQTMWGGHDFQDVGQKGNVQDLLDYIDKNSNAPDPFHFSEDQFSMISDKESKEKPKKNREDREYSQEDEFTIKKHGIENGLASDLRYVDKHHEGNEEMKKKIISKYQKQMDDFTKEYSDYENLKNLSFIRQAIKKKKPKT